jgi:hypothetical protein
MLQVTIDFSLEGLSKSGFPLSLLRRARFLRFLRQDLYGFQVSYTVRASGASAFKQRLQRQYEAVQGMQRLSWDDKAELETLLIRGRWLSSRNTVERDQAAKTLRCLAGCQAHFQRPPQLNGNSLRVSIVGERSRVMRMLARFDRLKVPHKVAKLAERAPIVKAK